MLPTASSKPRSKKPRAWRVTDEKTAPGQWKRVMYAGGAFILAGGIGAAVLLASGAMGSAPAAKPSPTAVSSLAGRQIVSSSLVGETPTATASPLAVTPVPPVGGSQAAPASPAFSAGPPAAVQPVTPIAARQPGAAGPSAATPASSLPGTLVQAGAAASPTSAVGAGSIPNDLKALTNEAAALAAQAASVSGSATPGASGTARPAPTETPISTAAPPVPPKA